MGLAAFNMSRRKAAVKTAVVTEEPKVEAPEAPAVEPKVEAPEAPAVEPEKLTKKIGK